MIFSTKDFLEKLIPVFIINKNINHYLLQKFTIPKLRDYKYDILLIYMKLINNKIFSKFDNKIIVYSILDGEINNINYLSTKNELENLLKQWNFNSSNNTNS